MRFYHRLKSSVGKVLGERVNQPILDKHSTDSQHYYKSEVELQTKGNFIRNYILKKNSYIMKGETLILYLTKPETVWEDIPRYHKVLVCRRYRRNRDIEESAQGTKLTVRHDSQAHQEQRCTKLHASWGMSFRRVWLGSPWRESAGPTEQKRWLPRSPCRSLLAWPRIVMTAWRSPEGY